MKSLRLSWPQVLFVFVWACCASRWKSSGCWASQRTDRHNFQTIWGGFFVQKCSFSLNVHRLPLEILAFCTKDSAGLTMSLFLGLCSERRECNRLELWCGISSCCMSDKVKGLWYEHGKILEELEGKRHQQQQLSLSALQCAEQGAHCGSYVELLSVRNMESSWFFVGMNKC